MRPAADTSASRAVKLVLVPREKGDANRDAMDTMLKAARDTAPLGVFGLGDREKETGPVAEGWFTDVASAGVPTVDATRGVELFLASKDEDALAQVKKAGHLTARITRNVFLEQMESAVDERLTKTNAEMSAAVVGSLEKLPEFKISVDTEDFDFLLGPVVQSGGGYSAAVTTSTLQSNASRFTDDVIVFSAAMRYRQHRCVCARARWQAHPSNGSCLGGAAGN